MLEVKEFVGAQVQQRSTLKHCDFLAKLQAENGRFTIKNYTIVKMLRYKTRKGIDFSNFDKRQENAGDGTYIANYDCSPEQEQRDRNGIHLIGLVGDAPIAVLSIFPCDQRYILLHYVGVLISYQNKGVRQKNCKRSCRYCKKNERLNG